MPPIQLGWIDYSSQHRDKVMAVLHALTAPGAVDELGIGQIRDGFANKLFPGTSTIQTRAKYFLIVPYLLMELEKQHHKSPVTFLQKLSQMELDLIDPLVKTGEAGIIGEIAGKKLKRKPSSIYWSGLRTLGIFRYPKYSLEDYARAICKINKELTTQKALGLRIDDDHAQDNPDAYQSPVPGGFWHFLVLPENWRKQPSIQLTDEEAAYLKDRIIKSPFTKDTLFAYLVKQDLESIQPIQDIEAVGQRFDLPAHIRGVYDRAIRFSDFIYGATLRYNVILSDGKNNKAVREWETWRQSNFVRNYFAEYDPYEAMFFLGVNNYRLQRFLKQWHQKYLSGDINAMDELIVQREIEIKSRERAKLCNPSVYVYQDGHGMRGSKLDYRFSNAKIILIDIFNGLEKGNVQAVQ